MLTSNLVGANFGSNLNSGYDISCNLKSFLRNRSLDHLLPSKLFTPEMHAKGHRQSCQLDSAAYFRFGLDMEDGEACERLFSELRRFLSHTTTMKVENRIYQDGRNGQGYMRGRMHHHLQRIRII